MKTYKNVVDYISKAPIERQDTLKKVRKIVLTTVPDANEGISYGMPAYMWKGEPLFYFAAMKGHLGLYPTPGPIEVLQEKLANFSTSKGCVRVSWVQEVPKNIVVKLLKERKKEIKVSISK